jgi:magnesium-transporting ATPase (P-type)
MIAIKPQKKSEFVRFIVKGAPELVMPLCTHYINNEGELQIMKLDMREKVLNEEILEKQAKRGLRTIVYAYKEMSIDDWEF